MPVSFQRCVFFLFLGGVSVIRMCRGSRSWGPEFHVKAVHLFFAVLRLPGPPSQQSSDNGT